MGSAVRHKHSEEKQSPPLIFTSMFPGQRFIIYRQTGMFDASPTSYVQPDVKLNDD